MRTRLALLQGALITASGTVLLGILYLLVRGRPESRFRTVPNVEYPTGQQPGCLPSPGEPPTGFTQFLPDQNLLEFLQEQTRRQHEAELQHLLVQSSIALGIMVLVSLVVGWLVAGRILRPVRTMTTAIQRITARNLYERLAVEGPEDEMKDLSDTVDGLLGRLEGALDAHKRFVANAAHELRTPLTLEHALIEEMLLDRGADAQALRRTFEQVLAICRQQGRLLESLLTLTAGERGLDRREPLDLADLARGVLAAARPGAERKGLRVITSVAPARSLGDPALVERLVANLVDNAVDHNVPGGRVEVAVGVRAGRSFVSVTNSGRRIPAGQVDQLFEPFQRLDRTGDGQGHHGLGLSIVRAVALAHDASVEASARRSGGLVVQVSFPLPEDLLPGSGSRLAGMLTGQC